MSLIKFEKKYKNYLENLQEWGFLRVYCRPFFHKNSANIRKKRKKIVLLKSLFFGIKNFFGKYEYIFFSDSNERKKIGEIYVDKYSDDIISRLNKKSLLVEYPINGHFKKNKTKYIISEIWLYLFAKIVNFFINPYSIHKIDEIFFKENLKIDYYKFIKDFYSKYYIYRIFLKLYRPKAIFINCYYCRIALVKAAKDLNIKVIEIQHGIIRNHDMYISNIQMDKTYIPDILLSWGKHDNKLLINKIIPIGSWYINYIKKLPYLKFNSEYKEYKYRIIVSLQNLNEDINNEFFNFLVSLRQDILFILIPRNQEINFNFPKNFLILNEDCYRVLNSSDLHMSLYSSCAMEAPAFGKANILLNIKGLSNKYFKDLEYTKIISSKTEFDNAIKEFKNIKNIDKFYNLIVNNYEENITKFIKELDENKI